MISLLEAGEQRVQAQGGGAVAGDGDLAFRLGWLAGEELHEPVALLRRELLQVSQVALVAVADVGMELLGREAVEVPPDALPHLLRRRLGTIHVLQNGELVDLGARAQVGDGLLHRPLVAVGRSLPVRGTDRAEPAVEHLVLPSNGSDYGREILLLRRLRLHLGTSVRRGAGATTR